jgi:hypothetical protein
MRHPLGTTIKISIDHFGFERPHSVIHIDLENPGLEQMVRVGVSPHPFLLRLRLWFALRRASKTLKRLLDFKARQGF